MTRIALSAGKIPARFACAQFATTLLPAVILSGCAPDSYVGSRAFVVQGKLESKSCPELATLHKAASTRIEELNKLMKKAEEEASGRVVSAAIYWPTLAEVRAERRIIEETSAEKKCDAAAGTAPR